MDIEKESHPGDSTAHRGSRDEPAGGPTSGSGERERLSGGLESDVRVVRNGGERSDPCFVSGPALVSFFPAVFGVSSLD